MNIGDKLLIYGIEYTIISIKDDIYHLMNEFGHGISCDEECLLKFRENNKI